MEFLMATDLQKPGLTPSVYQLEQSYGLYLHPEDDPDMQDFTNEGDSYVISTEASDG